MSVSRESSPRRIIWLRRESVILQPSYNRLAFQQREPDSFINMVDLSPQGALIAYRIGGEVCRTSPDLAHMELARSRVLGSASRLGSWMQTSRACFGAFSL